MAEEVKKTNRVVVDEIGRRLEAQLGSITTMDNKAGLTATLIGALLVGLLSMQWFLKLQPVFMAGVVILLLAAVLCAVRALLVTDCRRDPDPHTFFKKFRKKTDEYTRDRLAVRWIASFQHNEPALKLKQQWVNRSFRLLAVAMILLCAIVLLSGNTITMPPLEGT